MWLSFIPKVFFSPLFHMFKDRDETFPQVREVVFYMGRNLLEVMAGDESVRFQFPELLCQA